MGSNEWYPHNLILRLLALALVKSHERLQPFPENRPGFISEVV